MSPWHITAADFLDVTLALSTANDFLDPWHSNTATDFLDVTLALSTGTDFIDVTLAL